MWARHAPATTFCAVARHEGGSCISHCGGRWPEGDRVELRGTPGADACRRCYEELHGTFFVEPLASDLVLTAGCEAVHPERRGGQHVAKTCTGVRIRHVPTGIEVLANDERSQHANREAAMRMLCERLAAHVPVAKHPRCDCGAPTYDSHSGACQLTRLHVALRELRSAPVILTQQLHTASDELCSVCGSRLVFSARERGGGSCGPCFRRTTDNETEADRDRRGVLFEAFDYGGEA